MNLKAILTITEEGIYKKSIDHLNYVYKDGVIDGGRNTLSKIIDIFSDYISDRGSVDSMSFNGYLGSIKSRTDNRLFIILRDLVNYYNKKYNYYIRNSILNEENGYVQGFEDGEYYMWNKVIWYINKDDFLSKYSDINVKHITIEELYEKLCVMSNLNHV